MNLKELCRTIFFPHEIETYDYDEEKRIRFCDKCGNPLDDEIIRQKIDSFIGVLKDKYFILKKTNTLKYSGLFNIRAKTEMASNPTVTYKILYEEIKGAIFVRQGVFDDGE
jgi:hypothetical protein